VQEAHLVKWVNVLFYISITKQKKTFFGLCFTLKLYVSFLIHLEISHFTLHFFDFDVKINFSYIHN